MWYFSDLVGCCRRAFGACRLSCENVSYFQPREICVNLTFSSDTPSLFEAFFFVMASVYLERHLKCWVFNCIWLDRCQSFQNAWESNVVLFACAFPPHLASAEKRWNCFVNTMLFYEHPTIRMHSSSLDRNISNFAIFLFTLSYTFYKKAFSCDCYRIRMLLYCQNNSILYIT